MYRESYLANRNRGKPCDWLREDRHEENNPYLFTLSYPRSVSAD